jgi:hypothetical protein
MAVPLGVAGAGSSGTVLSHELKRSTISDSNTTTNIDTSKLLVQDDPRAVIPGVCADNLKTATKVLVLVEPPGLSQSMALHFHNIHGFGATYNVPTSSEKAWAPGVIDNCFFSSLY